MCVHVHACVGMYYLLLVTITTEHPGPHGQLYFVLEHNVVLDLISCMYMYILYILCEEGDAVPHVSYALSYLTFVEYCFLCSSHMMMWEEGAYC